jgi:TetR/AcrR family transcriptional regulator, repressor for uid operon
MNVHSQEFFLATALAPDPIGKMEQRRVAILDAAEHVFLRKGFEGATMQDVAAAANMSPGNIYRYFASKSSIIGGLVERDRADMNEKFALVANMPNKMAAFEELGRGYFKHEACPKSPLTLEIWASAARDPEIRAAVSVIESSVISNVMALLEAARANAEIPLDADLTLVCDLIMMLSDGIMQNCAVNPDADIDRQLTIMFATIHAACRGDIKIEATQSGRLA